MKRMVAVIDAGEESGPVLFLCKDVVPGDLLMLAYSAIDTSDASSADLKRIGEVYESFTKCFDAD